MALICYVVLAVLIFGFRVAMQRKKTGDHGLRVATQLKTPVQKLATYIQVLVLLGVLAIAILESLNVLQPQLNLGIYGTIAGLALCALGSAITMVSQFQMGKSWRIGVDETEETDLITHGMFSVSRNPIYLGMMVIGLAFMALVPHAYMVACYVLAIIGIDLQVRKIEEPHLRRAFGDQYANYIGKVGRYFPRLRGA